MKVLVVLARAPSAPGKTRLTAHLSREQGHALRLALLLDTLDIARSVGVPVCVRYTPRESAEEMAALVGDVLLAQQSDGDLGARMMDAVTSSFEAGANAVVVIGSDLPTLPRAHLVDAFVRLEAGADCVFGPADDGGYYALGVSGRDVNAEERVARLRRLFAEISWGTDTVFKQSLAAASTAGFDAEIIAAWYDVDQPDDLARALGEPQSLARRTRAWCREFSA